MTATTAFANPALPRHRRIELLAAAAPAALIELADQCLADAPSPVLVAGPEVGLVMYQVREPVEHSRFCLGEILVSRADIEHRGCRGWSMRLGEDADAALAAAVLDAEVESDGAYSGAVDELCRRTELELDREAVLERHALSATEVRFEGLDGDEN